MRVVRRVLGPAEDKIKVRGFDDLMVFRARCCNPIRGEKIIGYITRGKGVSVHSAACTNVVNLLYDPERKIDVEWDKGSDALPYTVRLSLQVEDRKGILADVTSKIAGINTNIRNVEATSDADQRGRIDMTVEISDLKHLQKVVKALRSVDGVVDVESARRRRGTKSQGTKSRTRAFVIFVLCAQPWPLERSDDLDFDEAVFRKPRDLDGGPRRRRRREVGRVDLVDLARSRSCRPDRPWP